MATGPTYYAILGIEPDATEDEIRKAYHKAARLTHPDMTGGVESPYFVVVAEAFEVLSNPLTRARYDASLANLADGPATAPPPRPPGASGYSHGAAGGGTANGPGNPGGAGAGGAGAGGAGAQGVGPTTSKPSCTSCGCSLLGLLLLLFSILVLLGFVASIFGCSPAPTTAQPPPPHYSQSNGGKAAG